MVFFESVAITLTVLCHSYRIDCTKNSFRYDLMVNGRRINGLKNHAQKQMRCSLSMMHLGLHRDMQLIPCLKRKDKEFREARESGGVDYVDTEFQIKFLNSSKTSFGGDSFSLLWGLVGRRSRSRSWSIRNASRCMMSMSNVAAET